MLFRLKIFLSFKPFFIFLFLGLSFCSSLQAYTDEVQAGFEEIWKAAEDVLTPYGIRKMSLEEKRLETKWIEDRVLRTRRLLPVGSEVKIKQLFARRYRIFVQLEDKPSGTQISVKGRFQIKSTEDVPQLRWNSVLKPQLVDYDVERDIFFKILRRLEDSRRGIT